MHIPDNLNVLSRTEVNRSLKDDLPPYGLGLDTRHPLDDPLRLQKAEAVKMQMLGAVHGLHAPLRKWCVLFCLHCVAGLLHERSGPARARRLPGGPASSLLSLDVVMGRNEEIDFEDYLNVEMPTSKVQDIHREIEKRFG
ncbi:MAG: hypothetical protein KVP17_004996 [Porospora cf. gigantea B]|uniref:uncharacterized protein n=1 Tax=Porospora cf. gigantea B TaxID=2853592 RepID=UPI00357182C0|nr:MAG: hypothetical protein KVP17_004996 [Porospora cf. gigantea B]